MSIEVGEPEEYVVKRYTEFFVKSKDLTNWEMLPYDTCYTRSRYNACQVIRFHNGYLLYDLPRGAPARAFCPYIYRTRDFEVWEIGLHIPIMHVSKEDRMPRTGYAFTPEEEKKKKLSKHQQLRHRPLRVQGGKRIYKLPDGRPARLLLHVRSLV